MHTSIVDLRQSSLVKAAALSPEFILDTGSCVYVYNTKVAGGFDQLSEENIFFPTVRHTHFSSFEGNQSSQLLSKGC
jgi:hypothetical protein